MTLQEAEDIYKSCFGDEGRIMWKEIGREAYDEYRALNISREMKAKWDTEIIEQYFHAFQGSPNHSASGVRQILNALVRGYVKVDLYADRLLNALEQMTGLEDYEKITIIRYMGEDSQFDVSGAQFYCLNTPWADRMHGIMLKFMDFTCPDLPVDPRYPRSPSGMKLYREAVALYFQAYERWNNMPVELAVKDHYLLRVHPKQDPNG